MIRITDLARFRVNHPIQALLSTPVLGLGLGLYRVKTPTPALQRVQVEDLTPTPTILVLVLVRALALVPIHATRASAATPIYAPTR